MKQQKPEEECCPRFDPGPWDDVILNWEDKRFIKDKVFTLFYMPLNFSTVIKRMSNKIRKANAGVPYWMNLSDHTSKWNMDLYVAVDKTVPGADNVLISGNFISKVYDGPLKDIGKWLTDFLGLIKERGLITERHLMWYTTCPKCAKKYGKNYIVFMAKVIA